MWVSIVPRPQAPFYCLHQHLWGYFPAVGDGEPRPFLFRAAARDVLMLSRLKPSAPAISITDRIQAGRVYQFSALVNGVRTVREVETRKLHTKVVNGNEERRAWLASKVRGGKMTFCQVFDRPKLVFTKHDGRRISIVTFEAKGLLHVTSRAEFLDWLLIGPGKGKCWGCGLLVLPEVMGDVLRRAA